MEVTIHAGVCGFVTKVNAEAGENYEATLQFETDCPNIKKMAPMLEKVNVMNELFKKGQSEVMAAAAKTLPHITCPVPCGTLKAAEAAVGLGLMKDASITFTK